MIFIIWHQQTLSDRIRLRMAINLASSSTNRSNFNLTANKLIITWNTWIYCMLKIPKSMQKMIGKCCRGEIPFSPPKMTIRFSPLFGLRFKKINFSGDFGILMKKDRSGDFSIFNYWFAKIPFSPPNRW